MKKQLIMLLSGLTFASTIPSTAQNKETDKIEFVSTDQVRPNYGKPHKKTQIERKDLESRLQNFAKRGMDEDAWIYVEYKDGTGYAYEVGEKSKHFSTDVSIAHSEEMLFILSDENIEKISLYHFHPSPGVKGTEYFPPSPADIEFFMAFSEYFKFESSPKIDSRVLDRNGVFTVQLSEDIGYMVDDLTQYEKYFLWYCIDNTDIEGFIRFINTYTGIILDFEEL